MVPRLGAYLPPKSLYRVLWSFFEGAITSEHEQKSVTIMKIGHLKVPTGGNVQLGCKRHLLAHLGCAARTRIVQEPFKMKDENQRECLDVYRLRRVQNCAGLDDRSDLHGLRRRNVCEGIFDRVNLFAL